MNTYTKRAANPFRMRTSKNAKHKSCGMNTYANDGVGRDDYCYVAGCDGVSFERDQIGNGPDWESLGIVKSGVMRPMSRKGGAWCGCEEGAFVLLFLVARTPHVHGRSSQSKN